MIFIFVSPPIFKEIAKFHDNKESSLISKDASSDFMLTIPSIGLHKNISLQANSLYDPWYIETSSLPGKNRNTVIVGHSFTFANPFDPPFYDLDLVDMGDEINVKFEGKSYVYVVVNREVVNPTNNALIMDDFRDYITLYTCYPKYIGSLRLVIQGVLVRIE